MKLSQIISPEEEMNYDPKIILTGANAKSVYQLFNQKIDTNGISVTEGDTVYQVFARPAFA